MKLKTLLLIFVYIITFFSFVANSAENVEKYPSPFGPFEWSDSEDGIIEKACKFIHNDPDRIYVDLNYIRSKGDVCSLGMDNFISTSLYDSLNSGDNLDKSAAISTINMNLVQYGKYVIPSMNNTGKVIYIGTIMLKGVPYQLSISGWGGSISNCTAREILEGDTGNTVTAFELPENFPLEGNNRKDISLYDHMIYDKYVLTLDIDSSHFSTDAKTQVTLSGLALLEELLMEKYQSNPNFVLIKEKIKRISHPNSPPLTTYGFGVLKPNANIEDDRVLSVSKEADKNILHALNNAFPHSSTHLFSFYYKYRTGEIGYNSSRDLCGGVLYLEKLIKKVHQEDLKNQTQDDSSQL